MCGADSCVISISGNVTFLNNTAAGDNCGGGAVLVRDEVTLRVTKLVNFTNNTAIGDVAQGGAVYASNNATLLIEDHVVFDNNTASGVNSQGGAINTRQDVVTVIQKAVTFRRNHASYGGGVAAIGNMPFNVSDAVFNDHHVLGFGGGMYLEGSFVARVDNCDISNNRWVAVHPPHTYTSTPIFTLASLLLVDLGCPSAMPFMLVFHHPWMQNCTGQTKGQQRSFVERLGMGCA